MQLTPKQQLEAMGLTLGEMEAAHEEPSKPRFDEVPDGPELHRILSLPWREPPSQSDSEAENLAKFLTARFAKNNSPYPGALRPIQALALREAWEAKGLVAMMAVGTGKSLCAWLIPLILDAVRPLYCCPAGMVGPIQTEFAKFMPHWHGPFSYPVLSYSKLAAPKAAAVYDAKGDLFRAPLLDRLAPDLIVLDEAHACGNSGSATTKRIRAYLKANPTTKVVVMSGTLLRTSINQGAHLMDWALGAGSPLPRDFEERMAWAAALDAGAAGGGLTFDAGALTKMLQPGEGTDLDTVRKAVGRRILYTPGVIGTQGQIVDAGLTVDAWEPESEDPVLNDAFEALRSTWALPDGDEIADGIELARHAFTLGNGHYQTWFSHEGFRECLTKILKLEDKKLSREEKQILRDIARGTEIDTTLVVALGNLERDLPLTESTLSEHGTDLPKNNTTSLSLNTTEFAMFAGSDVTAHSKESRCASITATKPEKYEGSCVTSAINQSGNWETLLKRYTVLQPILREAIASAKPPVEWRMARNEWAKWCRKAIKVNKRNIHSEATMKDAVRKGLYNDGGLLEKWEAARDAERARTGLREPASLTVWVSDEAIRAVRSWLADHEGVVWVLNTGLGVRLSEELKIPFYGAQGLDAKGNHITKHRGGPAVSSIQANGTGKNLQGLWSKNLWLTTPTEQALGRTHRPGQKADVVQNWIYLGCAEHLEAFWRAAEQKTGFAEHMTSSSQKLTVAKIDVPKTKTGSARWR